MIFSKLITEGDIISTIVLWQRETTCPKMLEWRATELHRRKKYC